VPETELNIANKISRGGFTAEFLVKYLSAIGINTLRSEEWPIGKNYLLVSSEDAA
jgi:hypothetical protein